MLPGRDPVTGKVAREREIELHAGAQERVVAGDRRSFLEDRNRFDEAALVAECLAEQAEGAGANRVRRPFRDDGLEGLAGAAQLAGVEAVLRHLRRAPPDLVAPVRRRQEPGLFRQRRRRVRRTAALSMLGGCVERGRRLLVCGLGSEPEVARPLFELANGLGEAPVDAATFSRSRGGVDGGGEQRVRETHLRALDVDDPGGGGSLEGGAGAGRRQACGGRDQLDRRRGSRGGCEQRLAAALRERRDPRLDEIEEVLGHRQPAEPRRDVVRQRPRDLEGEERVAACGLVDGQERPPRERPPKAQLEQLVQRGKAERPDRVPRHRPLGEGAVELERHLQARLDPLRGDHADRLAPETTEREVKRTGGGPVDPLVVVQADDHAAAARKRGQHRCGRGADRPLVERAGSRLLTKQRDRDRPSLGIRQHGQKLVCDRLEQVAQGSEGELCLSLAAAGGQHDEAVRPGAFERLRPEGGLADSRFAGEYQRGAFAELTEEPSGDLEFLIATHYPRHHDTTVAWRPRKVDAYSANASRASTVVQFRDVAVTTRRLPANSVHRRDRATPAGCQA